jgi:hypothetical protein
MNKNIGLELIVYGLLLAGLGWFTHCLGQALGRPAEELFSQAGGVSCA